MPILFFKFSIDLFSIVMFFILLAVFLAIIFGATFFAVWLRTKFIWTRFGRWLVKLGFVNANGIIQDLRSGHVYVVQKEFFDFYNNKFEVGETLTFLRNDFLPYHGGWTICFAERNIYLQEEASSEILNKIWVYLVPLRK